MGGVIPGWDVYAQLEGTKIQLPVQAWDLVGDCWFPWVPFPEGMVRLESKFTLVTFEE